MCDLAHLMHVGALLQLFRLLPNDWHIIQCGIRIDSTVPSSLQVVLILNIYACISIKCNNKHI
jgi:hypothetical protein